jgi:hypothetical protein
MARAFWPSRLREAIPYFVIPDARASARSGIQMQIQNVLLDSGFMRYARAPE